MSSLRLLRLEYYQRTLAGLFTVGFGSQLRHVHRNHPGHKPKPPAAPVKLDLPDTYRDEVIYPPVKPRLPPGHWPDDVDPTQAWFYYSEGQKFHRLKTIQERLSILAYMNVQHTIDDLKVVRTRFAQIYGLSATPQAARALDFNQYITKTAISMVNQYPLTSQYNSNNESAVELESSNSKQSETTLNKSINPALYEKLLVNAKETILAHFNLKNDSLKDAIPPISPDTYQPEILVNESQLEERTIKSNQFLKAFLDSTTAILAADQQHSHLQHAQYANNVNIMGYWKRCGFKDQKPRGAIFPDIDTIRFQFQDVAAYQIKCDRPLTPIFRLNDPTCAKTKEIPECAYNPSTYRLFGDHKLPMQVPGHWYGDSREFNYLTVFNTTKTFAYIKEKYGNVINEDLNVLKSMAIQCGHAELTAQAYYLGFSMWKDLTYPLLGRYMFSNGQDFSFASYQLNTIRLWNRAEPTVNLCYLTVPERLYNLNSDYTEITEFNESLFKRLLNTLVTQPSLNDTDIVREYSQLDYMIGGSQLRPYLSISDFEQQLSVRHKLFAISLYELVKYDKPLTYLGLRSKTQPKSQKPRFPFMYNKLTHDYRDIVLNYYPRDYYGLKILDHMLKRGNKHSFKYWDLKQPVYEWANVPPPDINSIPREINLAKF